MDRVANQDAEYALSDEDRLPLIERRFNTDYWIMPSATGRSSWPTARRKAFIPHRDPNPVLAGLGRTPW